MVSLIFFILSIMVIVASLMVILQRNPVYSALYLVFTFFSMAGIFLILGAEFIAAIQVIVYAGAIMVLFLFVIMMLNLEREPETPSPHPWQRSFAVFFGLILLLTLGGAVYSGVLKVEPAGAPVQPFVENTKAVAALLFTDYLLPFEIASILLLVAIVGAIYLAKREP
ncbi:MAG: NADH-quinone oxidoreductase subunit J [Deltaproteobacteria bacterium]|nr:NADH-quinone oxidoreductase subunit J [Deltaproteobacteria bacterium]